ncbi:MAG: hypothetical protein EZS28_015010 [Streblomastix strix]|uniref:Uncharacterized protein n=1 Tax=Streblomastix strix TaxID=222440 RepID=A0A5J4W396_9EUKA|nr:MAG: hypothetical protein EZS28_015010 [Streblomastix strix]
MVVFVVDFVGIVKNKIASVSKQGKNDASILLAGGGDMIICSLVNQTELQEVRDITFGKLKAYLFDTQSDLNDWMAIQDNVAKLAIGDNLYIVDKQIVDYWWDSTDLKVLETEQPDMTNVITTLGTATGGGNAISDLSFSGNTLIPAKNINFVTADNDQNISGSKTFSCTIHSVGIQVQNYDNLSVVLAVGGVKAIWNINASVDLSNYYNKSQTYSQIETDQKLNLKLNISDQIDAYTKTKDDALLLMKADKSKLIDAYNKTEVDAILDDKLSVSDQIDAYTKTQDDALLLLKADKTQLIDSYTKGETNNLLNSKADSEVSYIKQEDDALLLLKADKTQLIDSYTKGETNNLLNNKADSGVSFTKIQDDALLLLKADMTQLINAYTKGETNNFLNNKADSGVSYTKGEDDALLGYMTLGTSQTITANKTFNNVCRSVSSIDGMATITGSQSVKYGADDSVVLLGAGGTKPISEFAGAPTDLSNYYTKIQTYSKTKTDNKYVRLEGSIQQIITGRLKYVGPFGEIYDETQDSVGSTYLTQSEVDAKLTNYVNTTNNQEINSTKTFNANVNATGFVKTGKDYTSVLLASGGDQLISAFGRVQLEDITNLVVDLHSNIIFNYLRHARIGNFYHLMMDFQPKTQINVATNTYICTIGNFTNTITPPTPANAIHLISIVSRQMTLIEGLATRQIRISTDSSTPWGINDEVVAAGLFDFPELYAYIKERYPKPLEQQPQPVPIVDQTLQQRVKNIDEIICTTNEVFEPPVPNTITKLYLSQQLERQSFLASSGSDPQLIVYGDRITLTASYATSGLFSNGYLFKSYPQEARPKLGDQVIALVWTDASSTRKVLPPNIKYIPIHVEYQEFSAMCLFKDMYDKSSAAQMAVNGKLSMFDCEFQVTYIIDNYTNSTNTNEAASEEPQSHIDELVQKIGKGLQWANENVYKPFIKPFAKPILGAMGPVGQTISKGLDVASSFLDYGYGADKNNQFRQDFETLRNDEYLRQKLPIDIQSRRIQLQNQ